MSQSLKPNQLHFATHSHHPWPDATREAHNQYWQDSSNLLDQKWQKIFQEVIPQARESLCKLMNLASPDQISEGTNTFELVTRVFSSLDLSKPIKILTTDREFYSFERFIQRASEMPNVEIVRVSTAPYTTFEQRFESELKKSNYDFVFSSLVFFDIAFYPKDLLQALKRSAGKAIVVVDIYHALGAVPLDLSVYCQDMHFVGGSYKYLSGGEGACFLTSPTNCKLRPLLTGWLADYGNLSKGLGEKVGYSSDGLRFAGATYDPSGWYRFNAVIKWWKDLSLTVEEIHAHARELQIEFLKLNPDLKATGFQDREDWGNFLAIKMTDAEKASEDLLKSGIMTDTREGHLRIGFGYYQSIYDLKELTHAINKIQK